MRHCLLFGVHQARIQVCTMFTCYQYKLQERHKFTQGGVIFSQYRLQWQHKFIENGSYLHNVEGATSTESQSIVYMFNCVIK